MQHWQWIENDISKVGHFKSSSPLSDVQQHNQTKSFKRVAKRASDRSGQLMPCLFALSQQISTAFYPCLKVTKLNHENDLLDPPNINMHKTSKCKNQNLKKSLKLQSIDTSKSATSTRTPCNTEPQCSNRTHSQNCRSPATKTWIAISHNRVLFLQSWVPCRR